MRFSRGTAVMASIIALLLLASVAVVVVAFATRDGGGEGGGTGSVADGNGGGGTDSPGGNDAENGITAQDPYGSNPLNSTANPPLPGGEPATHRGKARMTTVVSGQTFTVDVGLTVQLNEASGFLFAYAGTGTVPVSFGPGVAATADYSIDGSFTGTVEGEAFSGTGPATVQATVAIPGMSPQSGGSTEQLFIRGVIRRTGDGRLEGEFVGGSYTGTFWAESI